MTIVQDDLAHDETPRPPRYAEGSEPDEWERGLQATYESLTANLESNQVSTRPDLSGVASLV